MLTRRVEGDATRINSNSKDNIVRKIINVEQKMCRAKYKANLSQLKEVLITSSEKMYIDFMAFIVCVLKAIALVRHR